MRRPLFATIFAALLGAGVVHAQGPLSPTQPTLPGGNVSTQIPTPKLPTVSAGAATTAPTTAAPAPVPTVNLAGAGSNAAAAIASSSAAPPKAEKPKGAIHDLAKCIALADARSPVLRQSKDRLA